VTGAWYAQIYGTASFYGHLRFEPPASAAQAAEVTARRPADATFLAGLGASWTLLRRDILSIIGR